MRNSAQNITSRSGEPGVNRSGFTLLELLVVIGIIAILVGLIVPAVTAAKRSAQQVKCAARLQQIGLAYAVYAGAYHQAYPSQTSADGLDWWNWPMGNFAGPPAANGQYQGAGPARLFALKFVTDPILFYCPTNELMAENLLFTYPPMKPDWDLRGFNPNNNGWALVYTSYVFFAGLGDASNRAPNDPSRPRRGPGADPVTQYGINTTLDVANLFAWSQRSPSTAVIACDMMLVSAGDWGVKSNHRDAHLHNVPNPLGSGSFTMQGYGANVLFNDGHVVWRRSEDAVVRYSHTANGNDTYIAF